MIPRTIHYIWLSDEPLNEVAKRCIDSWKKQAKDFEIKRWRMSDFKFEEMPDWVNEAISVKKWAFACDYLRLYVLEKEGGFYLDSDVLMLKSLEDYLHHSFVSSVEYYPDLFEIGSKYVDDEGCSDAEAVDGMAIQAAIMGSEPAHPYVRKVMEFYENNHFILENGKLNNIIIAPHIYARVAREFGFKYYNKFQELRNGVTLYESSVFAPGYENSDKNSVLIHLCTGSWRDMGTIERMLITDRKKQELNSAENTKYKYIKNALLTIEYVAMKILDFIFRKNK